MTIASLENAAPLRADIRRESPRLADLADQIAEELEGRYSAIVVDRLNIDDFDLNTKRRLLYALCLALGWPTPTDKVGRRIIWDIKSRPLPKGQVSTFSENMAEALLHTDTQYFPHPERYTILYVVKPAQEGGISMIRDGRHIREALEQTEEGAWALSYLSTNKLPFRIPTSYTAQRRQDIPEFTFAPIFSDRPLIRYRRDTLEAGLAGCPEYRTAEAKNALRILEGVLDSANDVLTTSLPADSVLITNNHEGLHGRTEFDDPERHLIRIRISDVPPST
ncbi:TauD/TfdA family dioxygenase [Bradyrhizobium japonicum]|uniref:TauD/TfdA family dioxygenase n=1 Tax=Bradyrhizobium japonicum TaxID=375 RepID=UPI000694A8BD|nr:TauD/TfdA family dioxygenase [Bradyrhizobium japonicum]